MAATGLSGDYPSLRRLADQTALALDLIKEAIKGLSKSGVSTDAEVLESLQRPPTLEILSTLESLQDEIVEGSKNTQDEMRVDPLGLRDRKAVVQALDLLVVFEVEPRLFPGIGVPLSQRVQSNAVAALAQLRQRAPSWNPTESVNLAQLASRMVRIVDRCVGLTDVAAILISRYVGDILAALLQTAYAPLPPQPASGTHLVTSQYYVERDQEKRVELRKAFTRVFNSSESYLLLESLSALMTAAVTHKPKPGPKWFRTLCGRFLSRILLRPAGVRITIDYMVSGDEDPTAEKLDRIANLLLTPPTGITVQDYNAQVLPQVLELSDGRRDQEDAEEHRDANEAIRSALDENTRRRRIAQTAVYVLRQVAEKDKDAFRTYVAEPIAALLLRWFDSRTMSKHKGLGRSAYSNAAVEELSTSGTEGHTGDPILRGLGAKGSSISDKAAGKRPLIKVIGESEEPTDANKVSKPVQAIGSGEELRTTLARISQLVLDGVPSGPLLAELVVPVFAPLFYWYAFEAEAAEQKSKDSEAGTNVAVLRDILVTTLRLLPQSASISVVLNLIQTVRGSDGHEGEAAEDWPVFVMNPGTKATEIAWHSDVRDLLKSPVENTAAAESTLALDDGPDKPQGGTDAAAQQFISIDALLGVLGSDALSGIIGSMFITILREQEALLELVRESSSVSAQTLMRKWWLVSQVAMAMVDRFGPAVLTKHVHVLAFILSTLERSQEAVMATARGASDGAQSAEKKKWGGAAPEMSVEALLNSLSVESPLGAQEAEGVATEDIGEEIEHKVGETEMVILALMLLGQIMLASEQKTLEALAPMASGRPLSSQSKPSSGITDTIPAIQWDNQSLRLLRSILGQVKLLSDQRSVPMVSRLAGEVKLQVVMTLALNGAGNGNAAGAAGEAEVSTDDAEEVQRFNAALRDANDDMIPVRAHGIVELRNMVLAKSPALQSSGDRMDATINVFVQMVQSSDSFIYLNAVRGLSALADVHGQKFVARLVAMYCQPELSLDERVRVGEALLQTALRAGEMLAELSPLIVPQLINIIHTKSELADEESEAVVMAHSALSILSAMAQTSALSLQQWVTELAGSLNDLLLLTKTATVLRRAAVVFWVSLMRGYGDRLMRLVDPEILRMAYKTLRRVEDSDTDELTRMHARVGIEELDDVMRSQLFARPNYL